jgi:uncharacterized protein (DUF362 family)
VTKRSMSRRTFIRLALLGGIGAGAVYLQQQTASYGLLNFLRWTIRGQLQKLKPPAIVGLSKCASYQEDLVTYLGDLWNLSAMPDVKGKTVLLKPNLLDEIDNNYAITNTEVIRSTITLLRESGCNKIAIGDGSAFQRDTGAVVESSGLARVLKSLDVPFIDLNYDELIPIRVRDGWIRNVSTLWLPKHVCEADYIISMPKLKTHHWAGVTLGLKNLLGVIPGCRYGWPKSIIHMNGINATILGLYQTLPPVISIVDGIIGMEGNGPLFGKPVQHGLLAMGSDPLAVDIVCAQLMGFSVDKIPHLGGAAIAGIGQATKIETRGVSPDQLQQYYQAPPKL